MKIKYKHFPHPVLAKFLNDFSEGYFNSEINVSTSDNFYNIKSEFTLEDDDLNNYIDQKKTEFAVHIECPFTYYRNLITSYNNNLEFKIPAHLLEGKVEVSTLLVASENIKNYSSSNFKSIFNKFSFEIDKGDILAVGNQINFEAEKDTDAVRNIPSIFAVEANPNKNPNALDVSTTSDKIMIFLPEKSFETFKVLKQDSNLNSVLASLIVTPVLTEILEEFRNGEGDILADTEHYRWFRILNKKLKEIGIDLKKPETFNESSVAVVQELIGRPSEKALDDLNRIEEALM